MKIFVDADACPVVIKQILFRAGERTGIPICFIANQLIKVPSVPNISAIQVPQGFDVADDEIVQRVSPGDLVITADIPLASEIIDKNGLALNPRGEVYSKANIRAKLNMRDFMDSLRGSGIQTGGPKALGQTERKAFAGQLDKYLSKYQRQQS